jgi:hypothetical protein
MIRYKMKIFTYICIVIIKPIIYEVNNSYLYHKARNAILQVQVCGLWNRGASRGATSASTSKTFSIRVIHNIFSADNLFKAKYNHFC